MTPEQKAAWEQQAYGCSEAEVLRAVEGSLYVAVADHTPDQGYGFAAMSLLSDAQEQIASGEREQARQTINRAKLIITHYWMKARKGE